MMKLSPLGLSHALALTCFSLTTTLSGVITATPAAAEITQTSGPEDVIFAKGTYGEGENARRGRPRDKQPEVAANTGGQVETLQQSTRNRGRSGGPAETQVVVAEPPIVLEFGRETNTSSRAAADENRGRGRTENTHLAELAGIDPTDLTPEALANAAPGSTAATLAQYREQRLALFDAIGTQETAYERYQRLSTLDPVTIIDHYPDGGFDDVLEKAKADYLILRRLVARRQAETQQTRHLLSGGAPLSVSAIRELHGLLGV